MLLCSVITYVASSPVQSKAERRLPIGFKEITCDSDGIMVGMAPCPVL
jgi:hypothetical protein